MKIDLLHYASPPIVGGVESVLAHHARLMSLDQHQVRILAGRGDSATGAQKEAATKIHTLIFDLIDSRHPRVLANKKFLDKGIINDDFEILVEDILAELSKLTQETDLLIAHNVCSLNKNLALTVALHRLSKDPARKKMKLILWHHDLAWTTPRYRPELHPGYPWDLLRSAWPGAIQVTISAQRQRELANLYNLPLEKIKVIPNGVDLAYFYKLENQTLEIIERLGGIDFLAAEPLLLLPVRLTPRKNIEFALQMLASLINKFPHAILLTTGPLGPHNPANVKYYERLRELRSALGLDQAAPFLAELELGFLPDGVIADFYRMSDALFLPSKEEGFGIPILEAGLSGLPIFCADIPPLRELGGTLVNYINLDKGPEKAAQQVYDQLSTRPEIWLRCRYRRDYTWERIYRERIKPLLEVDGSDDNNQL